MSTKNSTFEKVVSESGHTVRGVMEDSRRVLIREMFPNCTIEKIIYENMHEMDSTFIIVILFIILGLKIRKRCKKVREYSDNNSGSIQNA